MIKYVSLIAATVLIGSSAFAQPPQGGFQGGPGGGPGRGGQGGGFGGPGGQGFRGGMMNRNVSVSNIPLRVLSAYLGLSDAQKGQIAEAREEMQDAMRPQMPRRNNNGNDGPPRFDPEAMQAQMQAAERKGSKAINEILNEGQRTKLTTLVRALQSLQTAGIRSEAALKLKLTNDQLSKLAGMTANAAGTRAESVLTDEQKDIAEDYKMPFGPPGGRGGFGGPGGQGGFGGPPGGGPGGQGRPGGFGGPPGGGQDGPPPF